MMFWLLSTAMLLSSECVPVAGASIRAGELAPVVPVFAVLNGDTPLAHSPMPGVRRDFSPEQVASLATRFGLKADTGSTKGLCVMRFSAESAPVDWPKELQTALKQHFGFDVSVDEIKILRTRLHLAPSGIPHWERSGLRFDASRALYVWSVRIQGEGASGSGTLEFQLSAKQPSAVTKRPLEAGHILSAEDFELQDKPLRLDSALVQNPIASFVGMELRAPLAAGVALNARHLKPASLVRAGQQVDVVSRAGSATIRTSGTARNRAAKGDPVLVWQGDFGRLIRGIATGPGIVEIGGGSRP